MSWQNHYSVETYVRYHLALHAAELRQQQLAAAALAGSPSGGVAWVCGATDRLKRVFSGIGATLRTARPQPMPGMAAWQWRRGRFVQTRSR